MTGRYTYSPECSKGGDGQCDGTFGDWEWCDCECHDREVGRTVPEVEAWHRARWAGA